MKESGKGTSFIRRPARRAGGKGIHAWRGQRGQWGAQVAASPFPKASAIPLRPQPTAPIAAVTADSLFLWHQQQHHLRVRHLPHRRADQRDAAVRCGGVCTQPIEQRSAHRTAVIHITIVIAIVRILTRPFLICKLPPRKREGIGRNAAVVQPCVEGLRRAVRRAHVHAHNNSMLLLFNLISLLPIRVREMILSPSHSQLLMGRGEGLRRQKGWWAGGRSEKRRAGTPRRQQPPHRSVRGQRGCRHREGGKKGRHQTIASCAARDGSSSSTCMVGDRRRERRHRNDRGP